ncbi:hypothetical protein V6Z11_A04G043400 [Gossypium hirsutum]
MLFKFGFGGLEATNVEATSSYLSIWKKVADGAVSMPV